MVLSSLIMAIFRETMGQDLPDTLGQSHTADRDGTTTADGGGTSTADKGQEANGVSEDLKGQENSGFVEPYSRVVHAMTDTRDSKF